MQRIALQEDMVSHEERAGQAAGGNFEEHFKAAMIPLHKAIEAPPLALFENAHPVYH